MFEKPQIIKTDKPLLEMLLLAHLKVPRFHRDVVFFSTMYSKYAGCDVRFDVYIYVYLQMCKTTLGRLGKSAMIEISDLNVNDDCNW